MTTSEQARHALYSRLQALLGADHADTLMTYLPREPADDVATRGDIRVLEDRFDRLEDRFDRLEDRFDRLEDRFDRLGEVVREQQRFYVATTVGSMTALTGIFSLVVGMLR